MDREKVGLALSRDSSRRIYFTYQRCALSALVHEDGINADTAKLFDPELKRSNFRSLLKQWKQLVLWNVQRSALGITLPAVYPLVG